MSERRSFVAVVDGKEYNIPTNMAILAEAEELSGASLMESLAELKMGRILQGVICAGLREAGEDVSYEEAGALCDFAETKDNYMALMQALRPNVAKSSPAKNAKGRKPKESPGTQSSDTPTDSSN